MKYLKSIVENKSWDSISLEEYNNKLWGDEAPYIGDDDSYDYSLEYVKTTREIFTTKEISILNKIIGTKGVSLDTAFINSANKVGSELKYQNITGSDYFGNYTRTIIVYKLKDEWYYVFKLDYYNFRGTHGSNRSLMYKCDQFDGLIDCLNSFK